MYAAPERIPNPVHEMSLDLLHILITFLIASISTAALALKKLLALQKVRQWPSIQGRVIESVLYKDPALNNATTSRIRYEFVIGDKIIGSTPRHSGQWFWTKRQEEEFVSRFAAGQTVDVFYDPRDPTKNCLEREDRSGITILLLLAAAGVLFGLLLVWLNDKGIVHI